MFEEGCSWDWTEVCRSGTRYCVPATDDDCDVVARQSRGKNCNEGDLILIIIFCTKIQQLSNEEWNITGTRVLGGGGTKQWHVTYVFLRRFS